MPVVSFDSLNLHPKLLRALEDMDFSEPTPIQRDSIPPALRGRHILACAATGSGQIFPAEVAFAAGAGAAGTVLRATFTTG
ncbi:MAG: DEAD/DEAH box helicase, partial [Acidobacteriota bacterium]